MYIGECLPASDLFSVKKKVVKAWWPHTSYCLHAGHYEKINTTQQRSHQGYISRGIWAPNVQVNELRCV